MIAEEMASDSSNASSKIEQRGSNRPAFKHLNRHVVPYITSIWHDVGLELMEIEDEGKINAIKAEDIDNKERTKRMLKCWLDKKPKASWNDLLKVLRIPNIGLDSRASEIEGMLLPEDKSHKIQTYMDYTSEIPQKTEEFELRHDNKDQQQITEDDTSLLTGLLGQSKTYIHSSGILQTQHMSTCTVDSASYSEKLKSAGTTNTTGSNFIDGPRNSPQSNNDITDQKIEDSDKSIRICEKVSKFYKERFKFEWMFEAKSSPISSLAALLVERDGVMKVAVLTTGKTKKRECSYSLNIGSADECMWGYCDGHAVSICYRFASFYLITEIHRHEKNPVSSILEMQPGGYGLREDIKLHFFCTKMPCGFMAKEDCHLLSWKVPFKGKPHCLKCSSIILINSFLGIQGPLSHLFSKPVYISSITIPKRDDISVSKATIIKNSFEDFNALLKIPEDSDYKLKIPDVEIADVDLRELFPGCVEPCNDEHCLGIQIRNRQAENENIQRTGSVLNTEGDVVTEGIIFTLENELGTADFHKKMEVQLQNATKKLANKIKVLQIESLKEAQLRLSLALNAGEALQKLKISLVEEMAKKFITNYQSDSEMEQHRFITNEMTMQINALKETFCNTKERIENDCNIQAVQETLPLLKQELQTNVTSVIESLDSVNKNLKEIEELLTDYYHDHQETLETLNNLLKKSSASSCSHQFYLDLLGCDWARCLRAMENDMKKSNFGLVNQVPCLPSAVADIDHQQQLSNENEGHMERNTEQQSQEESQKEKVIPEEGVFPQCKPPGIVTGDCNSPHQVSGIQSSTSLPEGEDKQHCNMNNADDNDVFDDGNTPEAESKRNESSMPNGNNEETNILSEVDNEAQEESQTGSHDSLHQVSTLTSSPQNENQQEHGDHDDKSLLGKTAKLVYGNNIETDIEQEPQNQIAVQEPMQPETVKITETVLPHSSHSSTVKEQEITQRKTSTSTVHDTPTITTITPTAHQHKPEVKTSVVLKVINSLLMIMFVLFMLIIILAICIWH